MLWKNNNKKRKFQNVIKNKKKTRLVFTNWKTTNKF